MVNLFCSLATHQHNSMSILAPFFAIISVMDSPCREQFIHHRLTQSTSVHNHNHLRQISYCVSHAVTEVGECPDPEDHASYSLDITSFTAPRATHNMVGRYHWACSTINLCKTIEVTRRIKHISRDSENKMA